MSIWKSESWPNTDEEMPYMTFRWKNLFLHLSLVASSHSNQSKAVYQNHRNLLKKLKRNIASIRAIRMKWLRMNKKKEIMRVSMIKLG